MCSFVLTSTLNEFIFLRFQICSYIHIYYFFILDEGDTVNTFLCRQNQNTIPHILCSSKHTWFFWIEVCSATFHLRLCLWPFFYLCFLKEHIQIHAPVLTKSAPMVGKRKGSIPLLPLALLTMSYKATTFPTQGSCSWARRRHSTSSIESSEIVNMLSWWHSTTSIYLSTVRSKY